MVHFIHDVLDLQRRKSTDGARDRWPGTSNLVVVFGAPGDMGQVLIFDLAACGFRKQHGIARPAKSSLTAANATTC